MERPLWLIGMMGSGKSTVAPLVAAALGREWSDVDTVIRDRTGRDIVDLFTESEARFRTAEVEATRVLATGHTVVATGGGAVMTEAAEIMSDSGVVVWLRTEVATLVARVGDGSTRPLLASGLGALERIDDERRDLYAGLADVVVDTDGLGADAVAERVVRAWASISSEV